MTGGASTPARLSTNQLDPSNCPPETQPRARMLFPAARDWPVKRQPPGMRLPAPVEIQFEPSVEISKVVRETSGVVPLRSQVIVWPSEERYCAPGSVEVRRAKPLRACPEMLVNGPPTRRAPSGWRARAVTFEFAEGKKVVSMEPSALRRPRLFRVWAARVVKQ